MSAGAEAQFSLGSESARDGAFVRQKSAFRDWVSADGSTSFPAQSGRYHLYLSPACPWSHRAMLVRRLKALDDVVSESWVDPFRDARGWAFSGRPYEDPVNGFAFLAEAYAATDRSFAGRVTVPVLWDRESGRIVNNESADIVRMLGSAFDEWGRADVDLYPAPLRAEVDALNARVYETVNDGVYRAGFASSQAAYEVAFGALFETLDELEARLADRRYLVGEQPTEADWRLWVTLVRFDAVYYLHFKCNRRRLVDYASLWAYTRELYQHERAAETLHMDQIKRHYYTTHPMINPTRIIPLGPELDFDEPHGRG